MTIRVNEPGEVLLYDGQLARVIGIAEGRTLTIELLDKEPCPTCGEGRRLDLLEHSRLFQEHARSAPTVENR